MSRNQDALQRAPKVLQKVREDLRGLGIQLEFIYYYPDECSCCYFPDWDDSFTMQAKIPLNVAPNRFAYTEPPDEFDDADDNEWDYWGLTGWDAWDESVNDHFDDSGKVLKACFISYDGTDELIETAGQEVYSSLAKLGYDVAWTGDTRDSIGLVEGSAPRVEL